MGCALLFFDHNGKAVKMIFHESFRFFQIAMIMIFQDLGCLPFFFDFSERAQQIL